LRRSRRSRRSRREDREENIEKRIGEKRISRREDREEKIKERRSRREDQGEKIEKRRKDKHSGPCKFDFDESLILSVLHKFFDLLGSSQDLRPLSTPQRKEGRKRSTHTRLAAKTQRNRAHNARLSCAVRSDHHVELGPWKELERLFHQLSCLLCPRPKGRGKREGNFTSHRSYVTKLCSLTRTMEPFGWDAKGLSVSDVSSGFGLRGDRLEEEDDEDEEEEEGFLAFVFFSILGPASCFFTTAVSSPSSSSSSSSSISHRFCRLRGPADASLSSSRGLFLDIDFQRK